MEHRCTQETITLSYPGHLFNPQLVLGFIESPWFTESWAAAGLDRGEDLTSLKLCIMVRPFGDFVVDGTDGLIGHRHTLDWSPEKESVMAYYAYWPDYATVYLGYLDGAGEIINFNVSQREQIRRGIARAKQEVERKQTIR